MNHHNECIMTFKSQDLKWKTMPLFRMHSEENKCPFFKYLDQKTIWKIQLGSRQSKTNSSLSWSRPKVMWERQNCFRQTSLHWRFCITLSMDMLYECIKPHKLKSYTYKERELKTEAALGATASRRRRRRKDRKQRGTKVDETQFQQFRNGISELSRNIFFSMDFVLTKRHLERPFFCL